MKKNLFISIHIPKTAGTSFRDYFSSIPSSRTFLIYGKGSKEKGDSPERINNIKESLEKNDYTFIHGHFYADKYDDIFHDAQKIVWFRNPITRFLSHYYYWKDVPGIGVKSFDDFIQKDLGTNIYNKFLNGIKLSSFSFIGIVEEYNRSIKLFEKIVKHRFIIPIVHENKNKYGIKKYNINHDKYNIITKLNPLDFDIYKNAKEYFERLCVIYDC